MHNLIKIKRFYFKKYKKFSNKTNRILYSVARNRVIIKTRTLKKEKEANIAKNIKNNPKAFYQYIASKTKLKEGISELKKNDGNLTKNDPKNVKP